MHLLELQLLRLDSNVTAIFSMGGHMNNKLALVELVHGVEQATSHYLTQYWPSSIYSRMHASLRLHKFNQP